VLHDLQESHGLGMLFITHDLDLAAAVTDRLAVMYAGTIVETGPTATMHEAARHPYTVALMAARPDATSRAELKTIPGRPVSAFEAGPGCVFVQRCPFATDLCRAERPIARPVDGHEVACHRAEELAGRVLQGLEAGA
jgi:oligopeptide/dipeptide ABC transporter ATP-binding protein